LGADVLADRHFTLDDRVAEHAEALDLDLDDVARLHRARVRRRSGEDHVARYERDRSGDVGDEVVHVPGHLVGRAVLTHLAVHERADRLAVEVPVVDEPGPQRAQRVRALYPQHRPGVRVAEIVQAEVVRDGVPGDVSTRLLA